MKDLFSHKRVKRAAALFLAAVLLLSFSSCRNGGGQTNDPESENETEAIPGGSLSVPYTAADSLNPFFMTSVMNSSLISLLFESLYYLDSGYEIQKELAESETVSAGSVKVNIAPGVVFSDGTPLTADDVVYSFGLALKSALFAEQLSGIESCTAASDLTVMFKLSRADVNVLNALTFPIVKNGSANTAAALPTGSGTYKFYMDSIRLSLICNMKSRDEIPSIGTIRLTQVPENSTLETLVDTGELDFCYSDLSSGSAKITYSPVRYIYLNNFVFLGVNSASVNLKLPDLRRAVAYAIDRQDIVESGFQGFARSATVPFNTSWTEVSKAKAASSISFYADTVKAGELFEKYGAGTEENMIYMTLICPDSNSFLRNAAGVVAKQLGQYSVTVTVELLNADDYIAALEAGNYDLYMGEIKIPRTMDLSAFFTAEGAASYGIDLAGTRSAEVYFKYRSGDLSLNDFLTVFTEELPFIPLCFRNGRMCCTTDIENTVGTSEGRLFGDIALWKFKEQTP